MPFAIKPEQREEIARVVKYRSLAAVAERTAHTHIEEEHGS